MGKKAFFAFATKQNHANLPPILSLASRGDRVCWLTTGTAERENWAAASSGVLKGRGIQCEPIGAPEELTYSPAALRDLLLESLKRFPHEEPIFVLNGGQKQAVLGMDRAAVERKIALVYSDLRPAQLRILRPEGLAFETRPLENCLTLPEYLASRELVIRGSQQPRADAEFALFRRYSETAFQKQKMKFKGRGFDEAFGFWFEAAVAQRVLEFLASKPDLAQPVVEVWFDVSVSRSDVDPAATFAEYDVLLLLANATVIHIECKTGARAITESCG